MLPGHLSVMLRARIEGVPALSALEADVAVSVGKGIRVEIDGIWLCKAFAYPKDIQDKDKHKCFA